MAAVVAILPFDSASDLSCASAAVSVPAARFWLNRSAEDCAELCARSATPSAITPAPRATYPATCTGVGRQGVGAGATACAGTACFAAEGRTSSALRDV